MIPIEILEDYNADLKTYSKESTIFNENEEAKYYFQIKEGSVKMFNLSSEGKEFTQGFFSNNNSFGEPPLFGDFKYPASALSLEESEIFRLPKKNFFKLLLAHPELHLKFTKLICNRMLYKAKIMKEVSIYPPEHRILTLLNHLKGNADKDNLFEVKLTRQQVSELTGLRVETVIRSIKKLEKENKLKIIERKVYL